MARTSERLRFSRTDAAGVVERMTRMAEQHRGWVNFQAEVPDDVDVPESGMFGVFAARGPVVPLCTWVAPTLRRGQRRPPSLGIQHSTGTRAAARLSDRGCPLPPGWRVSQDHPRRGLVVDVIPEDATTADMLGWLLAAGEALCPVPLTGWWQAALYDESA